MDGQEGRDGTLPLPPVGTVVGVEPAGAGRPWRTRVEWVEGTAVCVVAPLRPAGEAFGLDPGTALQIVWATELGLLQADGVLRGVERDVVDLWVVDVARVERSQRREAFRLPLVRPVTLGWTGGEVVAETQDLSETGLRCRAPAHAAPVPGDAVMLSLSLGEQEMVELVGVVTRAEAVTRTFTERTSAAPAPPQIDLGIAFVGLERHVTDRLRRFVFEEQLRRRSS